MPRLASLYMESNRLVDILKICTTIRVLKLDNNHIGKMAEMNFRALARLSQLHSLGLSYNQIEYIPNYLFENMLNLKTLMLSRNRISALPPSLPYLCPELRVLDYSSNFLSSFDQSNIRGLQAIKYIYLQDNSITSISNDLIDSLSRDFMYIEVFAVNDNPLICSCNNHFKNWIEIHR